MIGLDHIYFDGEDPPEDAGARLCLRSLPTGRGASVRVRHGSNAPKRNEPTQVLSPFLRFVLSQSGLEPDWYRPKALNRRHAACLRALRIPSETQATAALSRDSRLLQTALSTLLIGVSGFFRDPAVFEHLREAVLPEVLRQADGVRVYSAGCSSGQELYSVAILLEELGALSRGRLMGVDCRADAIRQARSGRFAACELDSIGALRKQRHFRIEGPVASVLPHLKDRLEWEVGDFGNPRNARVWDIILFRNAAIYLEPAHANSVWRELDRQLRPGGALVTGSAERPPHGLGWARESSCVYRKPIKEGVTA
ncbi:MAG: CheR family methyltransferase [Limisphaerales bacterium]